VRYELGFYIAQDGIIHSHRRENLKSHSTNRLDSVAEHNLSPVKYELGFYIPEGGIPHSHCRETLKIYSVFYVNIDIWKILLECANFRGSILISVATVLHLFLFNYWSYFGC
jgi:hypothetical protein